MALDPKLSYVNLKIFNDLKCTFSVTLYIKMRSKVNNFPVIFRRIFIYISEDTKRRKTKLHRNTSLAYSFIDLYFS